MTTGTAMMIAYSGKSAIFDTKGRGGEAGELRVVACRVSFRICPIHRPIVYPGVFVPQFMEFPT